MKLASILFFALLVNMHRVCGFEASLGWPLSAFRYGDATLLGYSVLCALALVGAVYIFSLKRIGGFDQRIDPRGFFMMLVLVDATPSWWTLHEAGAIVLLAAVYAYFAVTLYRNGRVVMLIHLCVPLLLALATGFRSYGIWQKLLVIYFVVVAVVHEHAIRRRAGMTGATLG